MAGALEGIRVLEWAIFHAGPGAPMFLGDLGAEVIKIEEKSRGDPARWVKKMGGLVPVIAPDGRSYFFEALNRNKKSIGIDLKTEMGREVVYRLVERADVFLTNFRRPAVKKVGMDYETLRRYNPKLIYARVSGYGPNGPDSDTPGYDYAGQARAGALLAQKAPGAEPGALLGIGDQMAAVSAAYGILAALVAREKQGMGQEISASIMGGTMWAMLTNLSTTLFTGRELQPHERKRAGNPLLNVYQAADGKWFCFCMGSLADRYWPKVCGAISHPEWEHDPRFDTMDAREENREELIALLDDVFRQKSRAEWLGLFKEWDLVASPVNSPSALAQDPQVVANDYVVDYQHPSLGPVKHLGFPVQFSQTPAQIRLPAPELGEHTEEILQEVGGYSWGEISRLKEAGVIA